MATLTGDPNLYLIFSSDYRRSTRIADLLRLRLWKHINGTDELAWYKHDSCRMIVEFEWLLTQDKPEYQIKLLKEIGMWDEPRPSHIRVVWHRGEVNWRDKWDCVIPRLSPLPP